MAWKHTKSLVIILPPFNLKFWEILSRKFTFNIKGIKLSAVKIGALIRKIAGCRGSFIFTLLTVESGIKTIWSSTCDFKQRCCQVFYRYFMPVFWRWEICGLRHFADYRGPLQSRMGNSRRAHMHTVFVGIMASILYFVCILVSLNL